MVQDEEELLHSKQDPIGVQKSAVSAAHGGMKAVQAIVTRDLITSACTYAIKIRCINGNKKQIREILNDEDFKNRPYPYIKYLKAP